MFKVRAERYVFCHTEGRHFSARLCRWVELPFPPSKGVSLGFLEHSEFNRDEDRVERVMFNAAKGEFYVVLEQWQFADGEAMARGLIADGWRLKDLYLCDRLEDPDVEADNMLIEIGGKYASVSPSEAFCLECAGTPFKVLRTATAPP